MTTLTNTRQNLVEFPLSAEYEIGHACYFEHLFGAVRSDFYLSEIICTRKRGFTLHALIIDGIEKPLIEEMDCSAFDWSDESRFIRRGTFIKANCSYDGTVSENEMIGSRSYFSIVFYGTGHGVCCVCGSDKCDSDHDSHPLSYKSDWDYISNGRSLRDKNLTF